MLVEDIQDIIEQKLMAEGKFVLQRHILSLYKGAGPKGKYDGRIYFKPY